MESKNISFMRSLCFGEIEESLLVPYPKQKKEEIETLNTVFTSIASWLKDKDQDFRKWDVAGDFPPEFLQEIREMGLFSLIIPEEFGGLGLSNSAYSRTLQELARYDASLAITVGAHSSIGMRGLYLFGSPEQKAKYFPKLATGEMIAAFCLTESGAGSDAAAIKTRAVLDGNDWVLNGEKLWITNGGIGNFFTVFAKTEGTKGQVTAFIVTKDMAGVSVGPHEDKMGLRASSTTTVRFDNVRVPQANVLGEVGKGFKIAMKILNSGRTGLGGGCVGGMKRVIALSTKQAKEREQFGKPIAQYGLIEQKIGHMTVDCYAAESLVGLVAGLIDQGNEDYAVEAAISKVFATEAMWRTVDEGLQVAGGNGFMREFPYERILRDCRVNRIFEGTNDILRLFIALTAMNDVGAELKEVSNSLSDPIKGFGLLSEYAAKRVKQTLGVSHSRGKFEKLHPALNAAGKVMEEGTLNLAAATDRILRKHGKKIVEKQFATKRLADIMIDLFTLASVISRVNSSVVDNGLEKAARELEILTVLAGQVGRRVRGNFNKIDENDDELIKSLAADSLEKEDFGWDLFRA